MQDEGDNYFTEVYDGKVIGIIHQPNSNTENVLDGLTSGPHTLELFKRTEWAMGKTLFYGFKTDGKILPPPHSIYRAINVPAYPCQPIPDPCLSTTEGWCGLT